MLTDGPAPADTAAALPAELERRIRALETSGKPRRDFDRFAWSCMILLGIIVPALLLLIGWLTGS